VTNLNKDEEVISEAVKIYFDYNCTVTEAVERARKIYEK